MGPMLRTIRCSEGTCIHTTDYTILHNHSTKGHTILPCRTDHTIRCISKDCRPMCSNTMNCCTMGCNAMGCSPMNSSMVNNICPSTMNCRQGPNASRKGFLRLLRRCLRLSGQTVFLLTCSQESLLYPSSLREGRLLMTLSSGPIHRSSAVRPPFHPWI